MPVLWRASPLHDRRPSVLIGLWVKPNSMWSDLVDLVALSLFSRRPFLDGRCEVTERFTFLVPNHRSAMSVELDQL